MSARWTCFVYYFCVWVTATSARVSYEGYSLLRVTPLNEEQLNYLLKINSNSSIGIDFWLRTTAVNHSADVMVAPSASGSLTQDLKTQSIPHMVLIPDIGKIISEDNDRPNDPKGDFFCQYRSYEQILNFLLLMSKENPEVATTSVIGNSFEGRSMILMKISKSNAGDKPAIWIQGGAHAREHIGVATVIYLAMQLISNWQTDPEVEQLVEAFDWYILPVLNPDGYEYSRNSDRLWRKTRSSRGGSTDCFGVDANRNWDYHWNEASGASRDPCSHNYAGPKPFSEPETRAVSRFMQQELKGKLLLFLDMHSYSQRWLTPWGYTSELPGNYEAQEYLAKIATNALREVYGTEFSVGSSGSILYTVSGGARDWAFGVMRAEYSYVVELRDRGDFGFVLPRAQIEPTSLETWVGVRAMALKLAAIKDLGSARNVSGPEPLFVSPTT